MYIKSGEQRVEIREHARGGEGKLIFRHLLEKEQLAPHSRLLCKVIMHPGNSMGYHIHEDEGEFFYILNGAAKIIEDDEEVVLYPGDSLFTPSGSSHSVEPIGDETLEYLALVISAV